MTCNSCRSVVNLNNTGICLGCQMGFSGIGQQDSLLFQKENFLKIKEDLKNAPKERKEPTNNLKQYRNRDKTRKKTAASGRNSPQCSSEK
jgi:hypothetical protein